MHIVMGKRAVGEVITHQEERIHVIYVAKELKHPLIDLAKEKKMVVKFVSKTKLFYLTGSENHGSMVAEVEEKKPIKLARFLQEMKRKKSITILALDQIFDPQNVGAILRASECFGVDLVIIPKKKGCKMTPVVTKASSGASELISVYFGSILEAIDLCKEQGFGCYALEKKEKAISYREAHIESKRFILIGSEGEGIRKVLSEKCDESLYIPLQGKIDSLNVSQATSILLATICQ